MLYLVLTAISIYSLLLCLLSSNSLPSQYLPPLWGSPPSSKIPPSWPLLLLLIHSQSGVCICAGVGVLTWGGGHRRLAAAGLSAGRNDPT